MDRRTRASEATSREGLREYRPEVRSITTFHVAWKDTTAAKLTWPAQQGVHDLPGARLPLTAYPIGDVMARKGERPPPPQDTTTMSTILG